jgi:glycerophosphoryl diester phosphodiesterase
MSRTALVLLILLGLLGSSAFIIVSRAGPAPNHPYFKPQKFRVIAHRGGAGLWPENTLLAFRNAHEMGVDIIEMDARITREGIPVLCHDASVARTTNGSGRINDMTFGELQELDAGYRWTPDGGQTYSFRNRGIRIPALDVVFETLPNARYNIEFKSKESELLQEVSRLVNLHAMSDRVMFVSGSNKTISEFRSISPRIATAASLREGFLFFVVSSLRLEAMYTPECFAFQGPEYIFGINVLPPSLIAAAHARNTEVHVWTIDSNSEMRKFIEMGVDGIITNYPDKLMKILAN